MTAASARACGPIMAIDLPGADPKVRAITTASQLPATSATALAIRRSGRSVIVEVLNADAPGPKVAVDVDQTVDPSLEPGPAEAGSGIKLQ